MDLIPFEEYDDKRFNKVFDVNVKEPIIVTLESIKYLKLSRAPVTVVASIALFFYAPVLRESISSNMSVVH